MGNLGAYQDIVVKAKDAGGVEQLLDSIEKAAASKAMPKGFVAGVATTIAAVAVWKVISKRVEAHEAEAKRAKATLTARLTGVTDSDQPRAVDRPGSLNAAETTPGTDDIE